jgi:hypothetical protein
MNLSESLAGQASPSASTSEFLTCKQLAQRWNLPESWVREHVRDRVTDPIPHIQFGKYVRFLWGSPELHAWLSRHQVNFRTRHAGRVQ